MSEIENEATEVEASVVSAPNAGITVADVKTFEKHPGLFSADIPGVVTQGLPGGSKPAPVKSSGKLPKEAPATVPVLLS